MILEDGMVLSKFKREVGKVKMIAEVESRRDANIKWILNNRMELLENFPNQWAAVEISLNEFDEVDLRQSVNVRFDLYELGKDCANNHAPSSTVYYLCNYPIDEREKPVMLVAPQEVWKYDTE